VRKLNRGQGVDVVYDGVGKDTLFASLDSLRPRGLMVSFGNASGAAPPFSPLELAKRGSLYFTRAGAGDYLGQAGARRAGARALFSLIRRRLVRTSAVAASSAGSATRKGSSSGMAASSLMPAFT